MAYTDIDKPTDYFNTKLYTGNGSTQSITGVGFQPDWVWIKDRDDTYKHILVDSVRGATKHISSNTTSAEITNTANVTSFASDGFALSSDGNVNANADKYVAWNWLAGGTASSNTDGSITSTVSANTTSGFSIVSWSGDGSDATIGHGLSSTPKMIIHKHRSGTVQWNVYHASAGTGGYLRIDGDNAFSSNSGFFGTAPTSSVFSPGSHPYMSGSGNDNIAYCFAEKKGYSKFGSYTGNGNADGTFVYTGFKPAFVLYKQSSSAGNQWEMRDNLRDVTFNPTDKALAPNLSSAEFTTDPIDLLSNGFKFRGGNGQDNGSGSTYIYMCFAENPFTTSTGIPCTAR